MTTPNPHTTTNADRRETAVRSGRMVDCLVFPVALVADDMVPVLYETFDKLVQDIEPQDVNIYRVVDAAGEVFRVRVERKATPSFWDRLASILGAVERYEFERSSDALPPDVIEDAKRVLAKRQAPEGQGARE